MWHGKLWMIDHGASLIFHHNWVESASRSRLPFRQVGDHVLLRWASELREADAELSALLTHETLARIVAMIPDSWLGDEPQFASADAHRAAYLDYFVQRLEAPRQWMEDADRARSPRI